MGASSSSSSSSSGCPDWYPGEPSPDFLSEFHHHSRLDDGDGTYQPTPQWALDMRLGDRNGGGGPTKEGIMSSSTTVFEAAGPSTATPPPASRTTVVSSASTTSTVAAATGEVAEAPAEGGGVGGACGLGGETRTMYAEVKPTTGTNSSGETREETKAKRDIASLPVVELTGMKYIAKGTYCAVFACEYRGFSLVAKRVRQDLPLHGRQQALVNLWEEFDCLSQLHHPNVIEAYGMCRVRCREGYDDWNEKDVCLLLEELAFGTIGHLFGTIYNLDKNLASAMARSRKMKMVPFRCRLDRTLELAQALEYVHGGSGIGPMLHRDIKSMNVGFARNGRLKLLDFGLAKRAPMDGEEHGTYKMTGEVGSYRYMAPELVRHEPYNTKVDIYSWAILSWEILAIDKPYAWATQTTFVSRIVAGGERPELPKAWPARLRKLLAAAWHSDHTKRPTASEIVAALRTIKAELPAKYQRQRPSLTAGTGEPSVGGSARCDDGGAADEKGRRHTWAPQGSRPFGGGAGGTTSATTAPARRESGSVGRRPSSARQIPGDIGRSSGTAGISDGVMPVVPPPLAPSSFSSTSCYSPSPAPSFERPRRWYSVGKRPSWLASATPTSGAEPRGRRDGRERGGVRGRAASGRESQSDIELGGATKRNSASGSTGGGVVGIFVGGDGDNGEARDDGVRQEVAEVWEATGEDRRRIAIDDDAEGTERGRRPPTPRRRISRRRASIVDALARETEGIGANRAQQSGPGACAAFAPAPDGLDTATRASRRASNYVVGDRAGEDNGRRRRNSDCPTTRKEKENSCAVADVTVDPSAARERRSYDVERPPRVLSRNDSGTPTQRASERGVLAATATPFSDPQCEGRAASNTIPIIGDCGGDGGSGGGGGGDGRGRRGSGAVQRGRDDSDLQPRLEAYGSLRHGASVAPETCRAEDVEDVSDRSSREVHRGRSLGKIWPSSSKPPPMPSAAGEASEQKETSPTSTEAIRVGLEGPEARRTGKERSNRRRAVSSEGPPAAAAAGNEPNILAVLGAPSGVHGAAEGIERRLAVVTGKLAMPRGVSSRVR